MNDKIITNSPSGGVQSVEVGIKLLKAFSSVGDQPSLNELAKFTKMHPAKAHRYLVSLVQTGLVKKTKYGRYALGPYILELATTYLARLDPNAIAYSMVEEMRAKTDEGLILSVWSPSGPTVIRWFQSRHPVSVSISPGVNIPTLMSASGRVFLAHLPKDQTRMIVERELDAAAQSTDPKALKTWTEVEDVIKETRRQGLASVTGHAVEWVSSLAAPIFDYRGEMVLSLAMFGFKTNFDVSINGQNAKILRQTVDGISKKLGYIPTEHENS